MPARPPLARRLAAALLASAVALVLAPSAGALSDVPAALDYPTLGPADATVEIVVVSDFQCPFCARVQATQRQILSTWPADVRLVFVHQPLPFHKEARGAAIATMAAHRQGLFWQLHDHLFLNQRQLQPDDLVQHAAALGLDLDRFRKDLADPQLAAWVDRNQRLANAVGGTGTPTFFVNGTKVRGAQPFVRFQEAIDAELTAARAAGQRGAAFARARTRAAHLNLAAYLHDGKEPPAVAPTPAPTPTPAVANDTVFKVTFDAADPVKGNTKDPLVTLVVFTDFQCPYCARLAPTLDRLVKQYGRDLRLIVKHNPLSFHKQAVPAAEASLCAHEQRKFWPMHDALFANMKALSDDDIERYAARVKGLNLKRFKACFRDRKYAQRVQDDRRLAAAVNARGTPNSFINGRQVTGARPFETFVDVIDAELAKAKALVKDGVPRREVYDHIIAKAPQKQHLGDQVHAFDTTQAPSLGPADAPVQLTFFADFQCPFSARMAQTLAELTDHYGDRVVLRFKHLPLDHHAEARPAARAALCAHTQGHFWTMHDVLFVRSQHLDIADYTRIAHLAGVPDLDAFAACAASTAHDPRIDADLAEARAAQLRATPALFINGRLLDPAAGRSFDDLQRVIDTQLAP